MKRAAGVAGVLVTAFATLTVFVATSHVVAAVPSLTLVAQSFNVAASGTVTVTVKVPVAEQPHSADLSLAITAYRPLSTRASVADAIGGDLNRNIDTVEVAAADVLRPAADEIEVVVPVEVTTRTPEALQLSKPGLYPLLLELRNANESVAELVSFIQRVPADNERADDDLAVGFAMSTTEPLVLDDTGRVVVTDAARTQLTALADLLESTAVPVSVRLEPSELPALAAADRTGADLVARLDAAFRQHTLLSAPSYPLDPSVASAATQGPRYTQWFRDGEDVLARTLGANPSRTAALVSQPLSRDGAALVRELGARLLVISPDDLSGLQLDGEVEVDTTQLIPVAVGADTGVASSSATIDAVVADTTSATLLQRHRADPPLAAIYAVADLLAVRNEITQAGGAPRRHGVVLATADLGPWSDGFDTFSDLIAATPGLRPTTLDDIGIHTDQLLGSEGPVVAALPDLVPGDIGPRVSTAGALALQSASTASMLPADDARADQWLRLIELLPTTAFSDAQVDAIAAGIRRQHAAILESIEVPAGFNFNLTGRTGTVRFSLRNTSELPLKVRVRLSSSKLRDSGTDQTVELAPGAFSEVKFNIRARSNGRFPANLELFTPSGDVRLAAPVPITVTITALSGLGNLITGAGLLVLVSWWLRHARANRRARAAAEAAHLHPATSATTLPDS